MKSTRVLSLAVFLFVGCFALSARAQGDCALCEVAVQYIDGYLQQNYTQAQITKQLEVACALAPAPLRPQCDAFVDYYAPLIVSYIVKYESPANACAQLGLCTPAAADPAVIHHHVPRLPRPSQGQAGSKMILQKLEATEQEMCVFCTMAVSSLAAWLKQNPTGVAEVEAYLEGLCRLTPAAGDCKQLVSGYITIALHFLEYADAHSVCQQLTFCTR